MIFGLICRQALMNSGLPQDAVHLEVSKNECNFIIQDVWQIKSKYRHSRGTIVTVAGADEYLLGKYFDTFVPNTLQGSSTNPRYFTYLEPEEFFRRIHLQDATSGDPYIYTYGDIVGYEQQLVVASTIRAYSSLASKTSGSINITAGSDIVTSNADLFDLNDVGQRLQKAGDSQTYKIGKFITPQKIQLTEKYRGASATSSAYKIGDVGVKVNVQGFVGGQIVSEVIELNGANAVTTTKTFNSLVSLSKSDKTGGNITCDNGGSFTVGTMAPGETEIERQTVLLWPKPDGAETLKYRHYMKHPSLWLDSDRLLIREKWHRLVAYKLEKRLRESFDKQVPQGLLADIEKIQMDYENEADDLSLTNMIPDGDDNHYGDQFLYDKDEGFYL